MLIQIHLIHATIFTETTKVNHTLPWH